MVRAVARRQLEVGALASCCSHSSCSAGAIQLDARLVLLLTDYPAGLLAKIGGNNFYCSHCWPWKLPLPDGDSPAMAARCRKQRDPTRDYAHDGRLREAPN